MPKPSRSTPSVLSRLNKRSDSATPQPSSSADLERAIDAAGDARDIAKDILRRLPDYDGSEEESTARHEIPAPQPINLTLNIRDSQQELARPERETPTKRQLKGKVAELAVFLGLVLVTVAAGLLQRCQSHP